MQMAVIGLDETLIFAVFEWWLPATRDLKLASSFALIFSVISH
jgi:hypothetical protein